MEYGEIVGKRKDDRTTNEEGYDLLDKIHIGPLCDVFHRNIDARVVAQASRPCNSIADVKDRVALLLHATYEELDDSTVNDVFAAVRSSILTFARERVTPMSAHTNGGAWAPSGFTLLVFPGTVTSRLDWAAFTAWAGAISGADGQKGGAR